MRLCFIVDVNVAKLARPLRRRGFLVFEPYRDYPADASDTELAEWALKTGCVLVTADQGLYSLARRLGACVVHLPHRFLYTRNSWEHVTKTVKLAAQCYHRRGGQ